MGNLNVLIDLNLMMHRWVHYLTSKNKSRVFLEYEQDGIDLIQGVHSSLQGDIYKYVAYLDRIFLIVDSTKTSWRKHIKVEGGKFYKTGEKEYKFDYKKFLQHINVYCDHMQKQGIYVLQYNHAEGDDLLHFLSQKLYNQGSSSMILTSDSDLRQLIRSSDEKFTYLYDADRNKRKHFVDKIINIRPEIVSEETIRIPSMDDEDEDFGGIFDHSIEQAQEERFNNLLNVIYDQVEEIDPCWIIFSKMLAGDRNDGVPPAFLYMYGKKNPKLQGFTELRAKGVWEKIGSKPYQYFTDLYYNKKLREELAEMVISEVKQEEQGDKKEIAENIRRNLKFVFLNDIVYHPDHKKHIDQYLDKVLGDVEFAKLHKEKIAGGFHNTLLSGSPYEISSNNQSIYYDQKMK